MKVRQSKNVSMGVKTLTRDEMKLLSEQKWLQVELYADGEMAFICGANGHVTIEVLENIERQCIEDYMEYFNKGNGSYIFDASFVKAHDGMQAYWDLLLRYFEPE